MKKFVLVLAFLLCAALAPVSAQAVEMQAGLPAFTLGTASATPTVVGFGGCEWLAIGHNGDGVASSAGNMTLLAKNYNDWLPTVQFSTDAANGYPYQDGPLHSFMDNVRLSRIRSIRELNLVQLRSIPDTKDSGTSNTTLNNQFFWPLSTSEAQALNSAVRVFGDAWWLRSPGTSGVSSVASVLGYDGTIITYGVANNRYAARPAFNLDNLSNVLLTSATGTASGKNSAIGGGLSAVSNLSGTSSVKFTVRNTSLSLTVGSPGFAQTGYTLQFDYFGATTGVNQHISCILEQAGVVKYYGKLKSCSNASAAAGTIDLPLANVASGAYTLKIFSEEANGPNETDFASTQSVMQLYVDADLGSLVGTVGNLVNYVETPANAMIGAGPGQYPQSAVNALKAAIAGAKAVLLDPAPTQPQIDVEFNALQTALKTFSASASVGSGVTSITANTGFGGTITNTGLAYTAAPTQTGYVIDEVFINGVAVSPAAITNRNSYTHTFNDDGGAHSIFVTFAYSVNFNQPANGTLSVSSAGNLTSGTIVRGGQVLNISATPSGGYVLQSLTVNGVNVTAGHNASTGYDFTVGTSGSKRTLPPPPVDVLASGAQIVATFSAISGGPTVPDAPTIGTATAGNGQATITFTPPANDGGSAITGYTVTSTPSNITASGAASPLTVTGLTNGTAYTFTVTATNSVGAGPASAASNSVTPTATATVPGAPTIGTAAVGSGQATITFTPPANDGGSAITGYTVTSTPGNITASGAASPLTVTGLTNGTAYTFTVTATNSVGDGPASAASNSVTPAATATVPGAPTIGTAAAGSGQATITFTPPANDGGSAITGYTVTSTPGNITASGAASPLIVTGLTNGTTYTFTVTATNSIGDGPASAASNSVTPAAPATVPGAPTGVSAAAGSGQATITFTPPANDGGSAITGYIVMSTPGNITASGAASPLTVTGLNNSTTYTFTVRATNIAGTGPASAASNSVTPAAPMAAAGGNHSLTLKIDGTVWAWGVNSVGQLGNGTTTSSNTPVQVSGLTVVAAIAAGGNHSLALKNDGTVWTWGHNVFGQLGNGTTTSSNTPVQVLTGAKAIAAGYNHSLALKDDGTVWAWGYNLYGQLGDGTTTTNSITPVQVLNITGAKAIAAGGNHSLALKDDGTVWAWGYNLYGQLGDGLNSNRTTPVQVLTGANAIAAGFSHSLALKDDGTVWAWGANNTGQLGDGTTAHRGTSVQASGLTDVTAITAGGSHSLALKDDGTVWAWGANNTGQLGDGSITPKTTPVQVSGLTGVTAISAGSDHSLAVKSDGTVWAWGLNNIYGQLGDGTTTDRTTPVQVFVPGAPGSFTAAAGNAQVVLTWTTPGDAGSPIIKYQVSYGETAGYSAGWNDISGSGAGTTTHTVTGLTNGVNYTFEVRAVNAVGSSAAATATAAPATVPGAPTGVSATAGSGQAIVTFTAPANDGGSAITGYTVTSSPGNITASGASSPITVTGLTNGTAYTFTVTATNSAGTGPASAASNAVTPTAPTFGISLSQTATHIFAAADLGYVAQTPLTVTINNTGNQPTGSLTAALSGTNAGSFALSATNINSIAASGNSSFTVVPNTGLNAGTYNAAVTVSAASGNSNSITQQAFNVSFTVNIDPNNKATINGQEIGLALDASGAGWSWNAAQKTLTLTGGADLGDVNIVTDDNITISVTGDDVTATGIVNSGTGGITITGGEGKELTLNSSDGPAISAFGDIVINRGSVYASTVAPNASAIESRGGSVIITGSANVTAETAIGDGSAISAAGSINISTGENVKAIANAGFSLNGATIAITNGTTELTFNNTELNSSVDDAFSVTPAISGSNTVVIVNGIKIYPAVITDVTTDAVFTIPGKFIDLYAVSINGHALTLTRTDDGAKILLSAYHGYNRTLGDAVSGSVIITLYKEFLASLPNGVYTLMVSFREEDALEQYEEAEVNFIIDRLDKSESGCNAGAGAFGTFALLLTLGLLPMRRK